MDNLPVLLNLHTKPLQHRGEDSIGFDLKFNSSQSIQQIVIQNARKAGITKRVTPHILRHCLATHLLDNGTEVRFIQELLGYKDLKTTMIYTHVRTQSLKTIQSPLDQLKMRDNHWKNAKD